MAASLERLKHETCCTRIKPKIIDIGTGQEYPASASSKGFTLTAPVSLTANIVALLTRYISMKKPILPHPSATSIQKAANRPAMRQTRAPQAPPPYLPQATPKCLQLKAATPRQTLPERLKATPSPPPVYRPPPAPKVLQRKAAAVQPTAAATKRAPAAPAVYRPQPMPKVLQAKVAAGQPSKGIQTLPRPTASPLFSRQQKKIAQPLTAQVSSAGNGRDQTIQRLIVIGDQSADVGRFVAVHNIQLRFPGHEITYLHNADLTNMSPGEVLYISAHGNPNIVGRMDAATLAHELLSRGLKTGTKIDLKACNSAVANNSYVEDLEAEVRQQSGGQVIILVEGYTGTHVILEDGGSGAKNPQLNTLQKQQEYKEILVRHKVELDEAKTYAALAQSQGVPLSEIAGKVAAITKELFDELYSFNETVLKSYDQARGTSSAQALSVNLNTYISNNLRSTDPIWGDDLVLDLIRRQEALKWKNKPATYFA